MGVDVAAGVGEGVGLGVGEEGVGLADSVGVVAGVAELIGVGTTAPVSVGLGVGVEVASGSTGAGVATGVATPRDTPVTSAAPAPADDRSSMPIPAARPSRPMRIFAARTVALPLSVRLWWPPYAETSHGALNDAVPVSRSEDVGLRRAKSRVCRRVVGSECSETSRPSPTSTRDSSGA